MALEGKPVADRILKEVKEGVEELGFSPGLAIVRVGDDPASKVYVSSKIKRAEEAGIKGTEHHLPETATEAELLELVHQLNIDSSVHGFIVQLPLPPQINAEKVLEFIYPEKDVDGLHPLNLGKLVAGDPHFVPATPLGVMEMLSHYKIETAGKNAVVVGRSNMVGKPMSALLLNANATVETCHSRTKDLAEHTRRAEILVVAVGKPKLITGEMVREGAAVIDVGINRIEGKLAGDVDFETVSKKARVSPVPGGVGKLTVACLMKNVLKAAQEKK
ncbi:bifunctional 5,10-methylene-tetrahydrofolate dehydrogenase/5,10-methylene-tetrahydrofolate cyclohydrolase [Candidatus Micrarchaeota archaeon]|nr:bifunctional 5,10-methylene-tetrahydrofolate dehydrogenase/5,10-methylene-tetrahydrofolate cyclohydrolase [Candidatus Micrarchaeota archaeon]MBD3417803.1 bifunctional 5,10-methylene-tetrahydrofolate dehydrogenase/5,10-methylene-tetrahydrofolate cyclohydrolase [Candidatus Micrarchaeota archaeon]